MKERHDRFRRSLAGLLAAVAALASVPPAAPAASTLWYNGNDDGRDSLANEINSSLIPDARVYDDFIVPAGQTWTITGVFSNDGITAPSAITEAHWEIRSGVVPGAGGVLLASGDGAATQVATGRFQEGFIPEYTITVSGLDVVLGPGTYYLDVTPDIPAGSPFGQSFISTTSGDGAVGMPPGDDGNSYFTSTTLGNNFTPSSSDDVLGPGTWDFSMGVVGTSATAVPEPSSLTLCILGGVALACHAAARGRRRPA